MKKIIYLDKNFNITENKKEMYFYVESVYDNDEFISEKVYKLKEKEEESVKSDIEETIEETLDITTQNWVNLKEVKGFTYTEYLIHILEVLKKDPFTDLAALTEQDIANGLLSENDIEKLRIIMKDGFRNNETINQIEKSIKNNIPLKDRITAISVIPAINRPEMIARTETVRLANEGLVDLFKTNGVEKVNYIAAISDRTCPICLGLDGQVFEINKLNVGENQPPIHPNCRCTLSVAE